jgi:hypothetical protein
LPLPKFLTVAFGVCLIGGCAEFFALELAVDAAGYLNEEARRAQWAEERDGAIIAKMEPVTERYVVLPEGAAVYDSPWIDEEDQHLPGGKIVTVTGKTGTWFRLVLADGQTGFSLSRLF